MKKLLRSLLAVFMFVALGVGLVACGKDKEVKSIYVDLNGQNEIQVKHKSNWDPADHLDVWAKLGNDSSIDINEDDCTFEGLDVNIVGRQTVTITYGSYEYEVTVNVYKYIQSISVVEGSVPTEVDKDGVLDTSNAKIKLIYSDLSSEEITEGFTISSPSTDSLGNITVEVNYQGFTATTRIKVVDVIVGYEVTGLEDTYFAANSINYSNIVLVPVYAGGTVAEVSEYVALNADGCNYTPIPTNASKLVAGNHTFTATYNGFTATQEVRVVEYMAHMVEQPTLMKDYADNSKMLNTYTYTGQEKPVKGFNDVNNIYLVGDDNPFKFSPNVKASFDGSTNFVPTKDFKIKADVYVDDDEQGVDYTLLTDNLASYVTIDGESHTFDFTENAIGKQFKIVVTLDDIICVNAEDATKSFEFEFKVVDGYNVHTVKELAVIDNSYSAYSAYSKVGTKWNTLKDIDGNADNGIELNVATNAVILHSNMKVTGADLPGVHFYTESEVTKDDLDYSSESGKGVVGSLKDSDSNDPNKNLNLHYIYNRTVKNGETFTIEGNYFQLDFSDIRLVVRESGEINTTGSGITTHTSLFGFLGTNSDSNATHSNVAAGAPAISGQVKINNLNMFGNAKPENGTSLSGGVVGVKAENVNFETYNSLTQAMCIAYLIENNEDIAKDVVTSFKKVNAYDSYNTLVYLQGANMYADSCNFIGAGGPVMICDHMDHDDYGNGGYTTDTYIDTKLADYGYTTASVLESWVVGSEGWFTTYGANEYVGMLKQLDGLFTQLGISKTIINNDAIPGSNVQTINIVAVYKSGDSASITTTPIRGSFNVWALDNDQVVKYNGLNYENDQVKNIRSTYNQAMCVLQSNNVITEEDDVVTENFGFIVPGDGNLLYPNVVNPDLNTMANLNAFGTSSKFVNVYLGNGMSAVLQIMDKA